MKTLVIGVSTLLVGRPPSAALVEGYGGPGGGFEEGYIQMSEQSMLLESSKASEYLPVAFPLSARTPCWVPSISFPR